MLILLAYVITLAGEIHKEGDAFKRCIYPYPAAPRILHFERRVAPDEECPASIEVTERGESPEITEDG